MSIMERSRSAYDRTRKQRETELSNGKGTHPTASRMETAIDDQEPMSLMHCTET
jgi:hypothetical protein